MAQADRNEAYLGLLAKDYGIKESELKRALSSGASAYGLDYARTVASITDAMNSNSLDRRAAGLNTLMQLLEAGINVPASAFAQYTGTGGSGGSGAGSSSTAKKPSTGGPMPMRAI